MQLFRNAVLVTNRQPIAFKCRACGVCCKNVRDSIVLEPLDAYRIVRDKQKNGCTDSADDILWNIPNVEWILLGGYGKLKRSWIESVMERKGNIPVFMIGSKLFKDVWRAPLIQEYPPLLYRPAEKTLPHCSECKYCYSVRQGKRGLWRACRHYKIVRQDKDSGGRHIPGRYAAVSPQWCPKRPETNWRFTKRV